MADYSFSPQFANLSGLQPLPALDVTRGAALQFQPLQAIQIQSSRPELVAEGIAGAVSNIAQGALSGITARYEKAEAEKERKLKFAQEIAVAQIKAGGDLAKERREFIARNAGDARLPQMIAAFDEATDNIKGRLPSGFQPKKDIDSDTVTPTPVEQPTAIPIGFSPEEESKKFDNQTTELPKDFESPQPEMQIPPAADVTKVSTSPVVEPEAEAITQEPVAAPEENPAIVEAKVPRKSIAEMTPEEIIANAPKVDYTQYAIPEPPQNNLFRTDEEAMQNQPANRYIRDSSGKLIKNPDYDVKLVTGDGNWKSWEVIDKRAKRISEQSDREKSYFNQVDALNKAKTAELTQEDKRQKIEIAAQKKKDAPSLLWKASEDNAQMLRQINFILDAVDEDESVLGVTGYGMSIIPGSKSREVRDSWDNVLAKMTLNALTDLREASPTGGALGNVSNQDTGLLKDAAGNININFGNPNTIKTKLRYLKGKLEDVQDRITSDDLWDSKKYKKPPTKWDIEGAYSKQNFTPNQDQAVSQSQKPRPANIPANYVRLIHPEKGVQYAPPEKVDALIKQRGYTKSE
jgi:hypothetical protein